MPKAGDKLTAADINIQAETLNIDDSYTPSDSSTWEQFGDEELTLDNPGVGVWLLMLGSTTFQAKHSDVHINVRIAYSTDGGDTYDHSFEVDAQAPDDGTLAYSGVTTHGLVHVHEEDADEFKAHLEVRCTKGDDVSFSKAQVSLVAFPG